MAKSCTVEDLIGMMQFTPDDIVSLILRNSHLSEVVGDALMYDAAKWNHKKEGGDDWSCKASKYLLTRSLEQYVCCVQEHAEEGYHPAEQRAEVEYQRKRSARARQRAEYKRSLKAQGK
ncbi:hypothetical protein ABZ871_39580 [Streptomyces populi]